MNPPLERVSLLPPSPSIQSLFSLRLNDLGGRDSLSPPLPPPNAFKLINDTKFRPRPIFEEIIS